MASRLLSKLFGFGTIREEVDRRVPTPMTTSSILKKSGCLRVQHGRNVHFFDSNNGITSQETRPYTSKEDISMLFYSSDDELRFSNESYYHRREYKLLMKMGAPAIDCLSAFPGDEPPGRTSPYTTATAVCVDELREAVIEEDESYDTIEESNEEEWHDTIEESEEEWYDTIEESEEEWYDTVMSVEDREEGDCDTSFIQPRRIVKAKRIRISSKVDVPAAALCINKVLGVAMSHEQQMESIRPMRKRIRISQDKESVLKEATLAETSSEVVSPPCPPSQSLLDCSAVIHEEEEEYGSVNEVEEEGLHISGDSSDTVNDISNQSSTNHHIMDSEILHPVVPTSESTPLASTPTIGDTISPRVCGSSNEAVCESTAGNSGLAESKEKKKTSKKTPSSRMLRELETTLDSSYWMASGNRGSRRSRR
jgi:hypothetical protein